MYWVFIQCQECYLVTVKCYCVTAEVLPVTLVLVIYTVLDGAVDVAVHVLTFAYITASLDENTERSFGEVGLLKGTGEAGASDNLL